MKKYARVGEIFHRTLTVSLFFLVLFVTYIHIAQAASLTTISDTLSDDTVSAYASHTIVFTTPTGITSGKTIILTFSSWGTISATLSGVTIKDNSGTANAVTSATYATNVITITASASSVVAAGHTATIFIPATGNQIQNPASSGSYTVNITGSFGDTGAYALPTTTNSDIISVTGAIGQSITFSLSNSTCALGALTTASLASCGPYTYTVATTAASGYSVTVQDVGSGSSPGLYKAAAPTSLLASTTATLVAGTTSGYGLDASINTGTQTIAAPYTSTSPTVGGLNITPTTISSYNQPTTASQVTNFSIIAAITGGTAAGTYSDTVTFLTTGNF
jgi:hypothetical protein